MLIVLIEENPEPLVYCPNITTLIMVYSVNPSYPHDASTPSTAQTYFPTTGIPKPDNSTNIIDNNHCSIYPVKQHGMSKSFLERQDTLKVHLRSLFPKHTCHAQREGHAKPLRCTPSTNHCGAPPLQTSVAHPLYKVGLFALSLFVCSSVSQ